MPAKIDYVIDPANPTEDDLVLLDAMSNILIDAVESGYLDYWMRTTEYGWVDDEKSTTGGGMTLPEGRSIHAEASIQEHNESDDMEDWGLVFFIDPNIMLWGVLRIVNGEVQADSGYYSDPLKTRLTNLLSDPQNPDFGDFDAADADIIIQAAVLGEVRYG